MLKAVIPFYIICFALYILFSRQPDYQDGEFTTGIIHLSNDSIEQKPVAKALYVIDKKKYTTNAEYPLRKFTQSQQVKIIYDTSNPSKAAVFTWWGYWVEWDELLASILIPVIFLYAAKAITSSPSAEAVIDEIEMRNPPKRKKYN